MESMPAPQSAVTVGVDTHLDTQVAAVIDQAVQLGRSSAARAAYGLEEGPPFAPAAER